MGYLVASYRHGAVPSSSYCSEQLEEKKQERREKKEVLRESRARAFMTAKQLVAHVPFTQSHRRLCDS